MNALVRLLLIDTVKRGWPLVALALLFPVGLGVAVATSKSFPTFLLYFAVLLWSYVPLVLNGAQFTLRTLPISKEYVGRAIWITTAGACAASLALAVGIGGLVAFTSRGGVDSRIGPLAFIFLATGVSGHVLSFASARIALAWRRSGIPLTGRQRVVQWLASLHFAIVFFIAVVGDDSIVALGIAATTGWCVTLFYYTHSALLVNWLPDFASSAPRPTSHSEIQDSLQSALPFLVCLLAVVLAFSSSKSRDVLVRQGAFILAIVVSGSGLVSVSTRMGALHVFRALPMSGTRFVVSLLVRAGLPVCIVAACVLTANIFVNIAAYSEICALSLHLLGLQMLWPGLLLNQFGRTRTRRIMVAVFLFVWALGGGAAIAIGAHVLAWIGSPMLAVIGYLSTRNAILKNTSAYRSQSIAVSRIPGFDARTR